MKLTNFTTTYLAKLLGFTKSEYTTVFTSYPFSVNIKQVRFSMIDSEWVKKSNLPKTANGKIVLNHENFEIVAYSCNSNAVIVNVTENVNVPTKKFIESKIRTMFEPNNSQKNIKTKVCREFENVGLWFSVEYQSYVSIMEFTENLQKDLPNFVISAKRDHRSDKVITGFLFYDFENPVNYGLKDIAQATIERVMVTLDYETKLDAMNLLFNYSNTSNKPILSIHTDLEISESDMKDLLNIEKMVIAYDTMLKIASLNNKQLSIKFA
jgi:hypothetical protein